MSSENICSAFAKNIESMQTVVYVYHNRAGTEVESQNQESSFKSLNISEMNRNKSATMKC